MICIRVFVGLFCLTLVSTANAKELGKFGRTYSIAERDAIDEVQEHAAKVNWKEKFSGIKDRARGFVPKDLKSLPRARKNRTFDVDMTMELPIDVPDGRGGIVYPKGTPINPLDAIYYPNTLVVINAEDRDQVYWFKNSKYAKKFDVKLLIVGGAYYSLSKNLQRQVFYATPQIIERFKLVSVPSVIYQVGNKMRIEEYVPPKSKSQPKG